MLYVKFIIYLIITIIYFIWVIKDYKKEKKVYKLIALIPIACGVLLQPPIISYLNMVEAFIIIWVVVLSLLASLMLFNKDIRNNNKK